MIRKIVLTYPLIWIIAITLGCVASAQADISLPGFQSLGDNSSNETVTYAQLRNYPFYVSLTSDLSISSISLENVSQQEADSSLVFFINDVKVATGSPGATTAYLDPPLNLGAGLHTLALRGSCYDNYGSLTPCSGSSPISFDFSIPDLAADFVEPVTILITGDLNSPLAGATPQDDGVKITGNANATIDLSNGDDRLDILGSANSSDVDLGVGSNIMRVGGNNNVSIYLGNGWNQLQINGSHNSGTITGGNQGDSVKIKGSAFGPLELSGGQNKVEILQNLTSALYTASSRDQAYIHGDVSGTIDMGGGRDLLKIDGTISGNISGGNGNDTLYVNMTEAEWNSSWQKNHVSSFETIVYSDTTTIDENLDEDDFSFDNIILHTADSAATSNSMHYLQKHHLGDNNDSDDDYSDIAAETHPYYPDNREGRNFSLSFNLEHPATALIIDFYRLRALHGDNDVSVDNNSIGTLYAGGDSVDLGSDPYRFNISGNWVAGPHTLEIESDIVSWSFFSVDYDDFSWDQIIITPTLVSGLDHFEFIHDGQGLTCAAESVILQACADPACEQPFSGPITLELPDTIDWLDTYQDVEFPESGAGIELKLQQTSATKLTLGILSSNPVALSDTPVRCTNTSSEDPEESCKIEFSDTGIVIDGDYEDTTFESEIIPQIAGKPSNSGYNARELRVRILRNDPGTGSCVAAVADKTLPAFIQYSPETGAGLADNQIHAYGNSSVTLTQENTPDSFELLFDADGTAPVNIVSADCGSYTLQINLDIPVVDDDGNETGSVVPATGSSNYFIVRPLAVFADGTDNPKAQNAAGSAYKKAGEAFNLNFKMLAWAAGRDENNDGTWDSAPSATLEDPSSGYTRTPSWDLGQPQVNMILPNPSDNLNYAANIIFPHGATTTNNAVNFDEVGIIQFNNTVLEFMGEQVALNSPCIGRFIPDHFALTQGTLTNRVDSGCSPTSTFTYLDEALEFNFSLEAMKSSNEVTQNYIGDFAKFSGDDGETPPAGEVYSIDAVHDPTGTPTALSSRIDIKGFERSSGWSAGKADFSVRLSITRDTVPDGPFVDTRYGIFVHDADGVEFLAGDLDLDTSGDGSADRIQAAAATILRYGRIRLDNAHGSELQELPMPLLAEYWNGNTFILNDLDSCTLVTEADMLLGNAAGDNVIGDTPIEVNNSMSTSASIGNQPLIFGDGNLLFSAPGEDGNGWIDVDLNVPDYLKFDWNGEGDENPAARATFGIFKGNEHIIYLRETTWR